MIFKGLVTLDRELSYQQAMALNSFLKKEHTGKRYSSTCLEVTSDGRSLQWCSGEILHMEHALADVIQEFLIPWKMQAHGVISVRGTKTERAYDVVVLSNRVKIYEDGKISSVFPVERKSQK